MKLAQGGGYSYSDTKYPSKADATTKSTVTMDDIRFCRSYNFKKCEDIIFDLVENTNQGWSDYDVLPIHNEQELQNFALQWRTKYWYPIQFLAQENPDGTMSYRYWLGYFRDEHDFLMQAKDGFKETDELLDGIIQKLGIHEGMPQRDAAWLIYNYILDVANYDNRVQFSGISDIFLNGKGYCHNYTQAFVELCRYVGIDAYYQAKQGVHAWAMIEFTDPDTQKEIYKYIDLTFGDVKNGDPYENQAVGKTRNENFLMDSYTRYKNDSDFDLESYDAAGLGD